MILSEESDSARAHEMMLAALHVVGSAILDTPLSLQFMAIEMDSVELLSPPLLSQLQLRLVHLSAAFTQLVRQLSA